MRQKQGLKRNQRTSKHLIGFGSSVTIRAFVLQITAITLYDHDDEVAFLPFEYFFF